jgi:Flp pilus assembly protein TadD
MNPFCRIFAFCCLLALSTESFADSEQAAERNSAGTKLIEQGKADAAIAEFQNALRLDPNHFPARLNLAYAFERAGRIEDAIASYRDAIGLESNNFFAHNNLGVLYDRKGRYELAIAEFESAVKIEPGNTMALKNLETAKKNQAAIQAREAQIVRAEKEVQAKPNDPQALYNLARIYAFYGKKELAHDWLGKAIRQGYKDLGYVRSDPAFKEMREERDFQLLLNLSTPANQSR